MALGLLGNKVGMTHIFDSNNNVKLGDFGLSRIIKCDAQDPKEFATTNVGTPYYMSPEQIHEN